MRRPPRLAAELHKRLVRGGIGDDLRRELENDLQRCRNRVSAYLWYWRQTVSPETFRLRRALQERAGIHPSGRRRRYSPMSETRSPRSPRQGHLMSIVLQDWRYAVRSLRLSPGFAAVAVVTLALGIGANTAIFSVVNSVLLEPLPFGSPEDLVMLRGRAPARGLVNFTLTEGDYLDLVADTTAFSGLTAVWLNLAAVTFAEESPEQIRLGMVTDNFFSLLRLDAAVGRVFAPGDPDETAVISYGLWQRRFGGDPAVLGKTIGVFGDQHEIIGVLAEGLSINIPNRLTQSVVSDVEIWRPGRLGRDPEQINHSAHVYTVVARLAPDATMEQAQTEADHMATLWRETHADKARVEFELDVEHMHGEVVESVRSTLLAFSGAIGLVLLIACANVANLLIVRSKSREGEVAIRAALGAGRIRLARQLLTESLVLSLLGGVLGMVLAYGAVRTLVSIIPGGLPRAEDVGVDATALAFTLGLAAVTSLLFGIFPALHATRSSLVEGLGHGARGSVQSHRRMSGVLIVAEVALSLVLLVSAGLLMRSFVSLTRVDPGFEANGVLAFRADLSPDARDLLIERIAALPSVQSLGSAGELPFDGRNNQGPVIPDNIELDASDEFLLADQHVVTPGYPKTMKLRLQRGRLFEARDTLPVTDGRAARLALVDRNFAELAWPGESPLGRFVRRDLPRETPEEPWEVIGVVGHMRVKDLRSDGNPGIYLLAQGDDEDTEAYAIRASVPAASLTETIRAELLGIDPTVPMFEVATLEETLNTTLAPSRFAVTLMGVFAGAALLLATVGLYGVISYSVKQRRREMGVRVALGASRGDIVRMVVRRGATLTLIGIAIGLSAAFAIGGLLSAWLYEVSSTDPVTYAAIALLLATVAVSATFVPACRAARAEPARILREGS